MEARATSRFARITAQKARLVVDMIRGKSVEAALGILEYTPKRAARWWRRPCARPSPTPSTGSASTWTRST